MPRTHAALVARSVSKSFGDTVVLDRVSLSVTPDSRIGLIGPNGVGKSTLLRVLAGIERADFGSVTREPAGLSVAYLAQEVLHDLPEDLQDFMLRCSILLELNPKMCAALTDRTDARRVLESLYRRNLFLTALDEVTPVLRFHDLFREFLETELQQRDPALKRALHERAARAEVIDSRAIYHLLAAQRWDEAMARISRRSSSRCLSSSLRSSSRSFRRPFDCSFWSTWRTSRCLYCTSSTAAFMPSISRRLTISVNSIFRIARDSSTRERRIRPRARRYLRFSLFGTPA